MSYSTALKLLDTLQSNSAQLKRQLLDPPSFSLAKMKNWIKVLNLDEFLGFNSNSDRILSVIHITGTKGKGSTAAFSESILRHHGLFTGLYTSPHLRSVRERIKLGGVSVNEDLFTEAFFSLWKGLNLDKIAPTQIQESTETRQSRDLHSPNYFEFLTLLGFYIFEKQMVDIAIIEVGIGGLFDATNVIQKPLACIITSLGMEHMNRLGNTIEEIAYNKGGILKPYCPAWTIGTQPKNALTTLIDLAEKRPCPLTILTNCAHDLPVDAQLGIQGSHQYENAALAYAACEYVMQKHFLHSTKNSFKSIALRALKNTYWPGRCQKIEYNSNLHFYLDGAHTVESLKCSTNWFQEEILKSAYQNVNPIRALIFYCSGDRKPQQLLRPLMELHKKYPFNTIYFTNNMRGDISKENCPRDEMSIQYHCQQEWEKLISERILNMEMKEIEPKRVLLMPSIDEILSDLKQEKKELHRQGPCHVLVTGSLYLVSNWMDLLEIEVT